MGTKGKGRSKRGKGEIYDEPKNRPVLVNLTETAFNLLNQKAQALGVSRQELVERFARGTIDGNSGKSRSSHLQREEA